MVKVNDYGPHQGKHPDRVLDLAPEYFEALGGTMRGGLIPKIKVELE